MASNKYLGIEEVQSGADNYLFKSDYSFIAAVQQTAGDVLALFDRMANGECDAEAIKSVMVASIKSKNGMPVSEPEKECEDLITKNGLQDCWFLARQLIAHSSIGSIKKLELSKLKPNMLGKILLEPSMLESSRNRLLLWAYHLLISGVCVCISFSLFAALTA